MFVTRLISGIVLVILSTIVLYFGGTVTLIATTLLSFVGIYELLRVYKLEEKVLAYVAYAATFVYYLILQPYFLIYLN